jgi:UDP-MurNAc hydroxylase
MPRPTLELLWINHASYALTYGATCLVVDPWLEGAAFNHGWSLLSPSRFTADDFSRVTHIWISHEHPDHFSPPTLLKIPEQFRRRITLLYRRTRDGRVAAFCRRAGFNVTEVEENLKYTIGDSFDIRSGFVASDCWLATACGDRTLVNMNDCVFQSANDIRAIKSIVGTPEVLLTQFSYANWAGNPEDANAMQAAAHEKLAEMKRQIELLSPRWVVPFASYVVFSHEENAYLNEHANLVGDAVTAIRGMNKIPVVLYPGDVWDIGTTPDPTPAVDRYESDRAAALARTPTRITSIKLEDLQAAVEAFHARLRMRNWLWVLRPLRWLGMLKPVYIHIRDLGVTARIEMFTTMSVSKSGEHAADIEMAADSLLFMLKNDFGIDTLLINGRFRELQPGARAMLSRQFAVARHNNDGHFYPSHLFDLAYLRSKFRSRSAAGSARSRL